MSTSLRVILFLLGVSLLALAVTGSPIYTRLSYIWGILLIGSWLWSKLSLQGVRVTRVTRTRRAQMGQILEERFEVINTSRLPRLWLEIRDDSPLPGAAGSQVFALIGGRQRRTYLARTRLVQRGVFPLGPTRLISGDPFGLFSVVREMPAEESLLIYPMMFDVRVFPNPPGVLSGGEALRRRTPEATTNAAGVREYATGDPLNRIHWLSTARRSRLMVKEFELDPLSDVWIFLDAERGVQAALSDVESDSGDEEVWGRVEEISLPSSTEEYAVSIAASLARYFLRSNRSVGFVTSGQSYVALPPDRGGRQLNKILEALASLRAVGRMPFSALVTSQSQHLPRGSTVILITPSVRQKVALSVDHLIRRGLRPVVILLDSLSFGGFKGSDELESTIQILNIPLGRLECDDDLEVALNNFRS